MREGKSRQIKETWNMKHPQKAKFATRADCIVNTYLPFAILFIKKERKAGPLPAAAAAASIKRSENTYVVQPSEFLAVAVSGGAAAISVLFHSSSRMDNGTYWKVI